MEPQPPSTGLTFTRRHTLRGAAFAGPAVLAVVVAPAASASGEKMTASASPKSIGSIRTSTVTVKVTDTAGSPVAGAPVSLTTGATGATVRQPNGTTASDGTYSSAVDLAASAPTGSVLVTALTGSVSASASFYYTAPSSQMITMGFSVNPVTRGSSSRVTAMLWGGDGSPLEGQRIVFTSSDPVITFSETTVMTGSDGRAATTAYASSGSTGGTARILADNGGSGYYGDLRYTA